MSSRHTAMRLALLAVGTLDRGSLSLEAPGP
jgi:hypothetical protein